MNQPTLDMVPPCPTRVPVDFTRATKAVGASVPAEALMGEATPLQPLAGLNILLRDMTF